MELEYGTPSRGRDDPQYPEGLTHIQSGEWLAALAVFEQLAARYPGDADVTRWRDHAEAQQLRDKRTRLPSRRMPRINMRWVLVRLVLFVVLAGIGYFVFQLLQNQILPQMEERRRIAAYEARVDACVKAADGTVTAKARELCEPILTDDPNNERVLAALVKVETTEKKSALCSEAEKLLEEKDYGAARAKLTDIQMLYPGYCDATQRIAELNKQLDLTDRYQQARNAFAAGDYVTAISLYEQVRNLNTTYEAEAVATDLYVAHMALGREIVELSPPQMEQLPVALDHFGRALSFRPGDREAQTEQRLASQFLKGQEDLDGGRLDAALRQFASVVEMRPGYLEKLVAKRLYETYLVRGDQHRDAQDPGMAYQMYTLAAGVPGVDHASAINRRDSVVAFLTPTPTPTNTPTPTLEPTATPYRPPTAVPTGTPPPPLRAFRGQIVFRSLKPGQEGFWVMRPDGSQKRYLGQSEQLEKDYKALYERESFSPDGRYQVIPWQNEHNGDKAVQVYIRGTDPDGHEVNKRITNCSKNCYDPVWAPDGHRIVMVSPEWESDDIWVINPDGTEWWNYTPNKWEWEKHPSWSPDSTKITFWSNREGTKQIYVIDENGKNLKKISGEAPWDEYDPLWIK